MRKGVFIFLVMDDIMMICFGLFFRFRFVLSNGLKVCVMCIWLVILMVIWCLKFLIGSFSNGFVIVMLVLLIRLFSVCLLSVLCILMVAVLIVV